MEALQAIDDKLFILINQSLSFVGFDYLMPFITNLLKQKFFLYGALPLGLGFWIYKKRNAAVAVILSLLIMAGVSDLFCYQGIKSVVKRPRPNHRTELQAEIRVPYGPKSPSFPSNHAATTMALMLLLAWHFPKGRRYFFAYAGVVAYSRVYVGVHYVSDVLGGMLIGWYLFLAMRWLLFFRVQYFIPSRLKRS